MSDITELWQRIVAEQHLTVRQCVRDGKPVDIPRYPPESIKLANECARLAAELADQDDRIAALNAYIADRLEAPK